MTETLPAAVVYAAKSTEDKHGSIPTQLEDCRARAAREGWSVVAEYQDEAMSAYSGDRGPDLARAMAKCEQLAVEHGTCALIVQHSDRLARGDGKTARHLVEVALWALKHDVRLVSVQDPEMLPEGELALLLSTIGGMRNHQDSKRKSLSVKDGMRRRAARGVPTGGAPPFGYRWRDGQLVPVPAEAEVVRRIYDDWINGLTQRALARALNAAGVPPARSGHWTQGMISRVLANPLHTGRFRYLGDVLPGTHEPIISQAVWEHAQQVRATSVRQTGGRWPDGGHLLVKGVLRCGRCGSAMIPRKGRPGGGRDRYECRGRVEHGRAFCDQPAIRRELVDVPFLDNLTDHYIDWEASKRRIEERAAQDLVIAREAARQDDAEVQRSEARLAQIKRGWQDRVLDDDEYREQRDEVSGELEAACAALERSQAHVERIEQTGVSGDAEQHLLDQLATIKRAVADGVTRAPSLNALRNVIGQIFESVELGEWQGAGDPYAAADFCEALAEVGLPTPKPVLDANGGPTYVLLPRLRSTPSPTGHLMPVGSIEQYPPSDANPFFARYCWW